MTCRDLIEFLMDFVSGDLPPDEAAKFQGHLDRCPACVAYLETYRATIELGKEALGSGEAGTLPQLPEELVQAILASHRRDGSPDV